MARQFTCSLFVASTLISLAVGAAIVRDEGPEVSDHKGNVLLTGDSDKVIKFPYYVSGYDYEDHPVIVMEWGKWDIRSVAEKGGKEKENFESSADQFVEMIRTGFFSKAANNETEPENLGVVGLIDFDGFNLRQLGTAESMKLLVKSFAKLERCHGQFAYGLIVNANPLVHQVIQLSRPFMGKFLERTEVYGTNTRKWIPEILKKIPRDQVHAAYGGTKDFRPVAVYSLL